jgi:hypothetical protein
MLTKSNDSQINLQKTTFIFQRNVSRMDTWAQRETILTEGKFGEIWKYVPPEKMTNI